MKKIILLIIFLFSTVVNADIKKVGVILPLSGASASYGMQALDGIKAHPKFKKYNFIFEDSAFDSKKAITAYNKLSKINKIDFLISFGGATCDVLNRKAQQDKIIHLAIGCNTALFKTIDSYNFRIDVNEEIAAKETVKYLKENKNISKIALISIKNSWAETILGFLKKELIKQDIQIVSQVIFTEEDADIKSQLSKLKSKSPDLIFFLSLPNLTPLILRQLNEHKIQVPLMSNISIVNPVVKELSGGLLSGVEYLSVKESEESKSLHAEYFTVNKDFGLFSHWGYDSVLLADLSLTSNNPRESLINNEIIGTFNKYKFNNFGELVLEYEILTIS